MPASGSRLSPFSFFPCTGISFRSPAAAGRSGLPRVFTTWRFRIDPGIRQVALISRLIRASMLEILNEDFIRTARSKGLAERVVIYKHAFRNALIRP